MKIKQNIYTEYLRTFYLHSKVETIINESGIDGNRFKSIYTTVISDIQEILGKSSG